MKEIYYVYRYVDCEFKVEKVEEGNVLPEKNCLYKMEVVVENDDGKGNGLKKIYIWTNGEVKEIKEGLWSVHPVVALSYNWHGESIHLKATIDDEVMEVEDKPTKSLLKTSEWEAPKRVAELIYKLSKAKSIDHYRCIESFENLKRTVYADGCNSISAAKFIEILEQLKQAILLVRGIDKNLPEEGESLKRQLQKMIDKINARFTVNSNLY